MLVKTQFKKIFRGVNIENNYFLELFEIILVCEAANLQFTLQLPS